MLAFKNHLVSGSCNTYKIEQSISDLSVCWNSFNYTKDVVLLSNLIKKLYDIFQSFLRAFRI